jgi:hypothetical protein
LPQVVKEFLRERCFVDGTKDAHPEEKATVSNGKVTIDTDFDIVLLRNK